MSKYLNSTRFSLLGVFLSMLLLALPGQPTFAMMRKIELKELKQRSHAIIRGRVVKKQSQWNEEKNFIWTYVDIQVHTWIKDKDGKQEKLITLKLPGGTVGDMRQIHSEQAVLNEDEEVILFLDKEVSQDKEYYTIPAAEQGKISLEHGRIVQPGISVEDFLKNLAGE